jgi:hypothetical protein
VVGFDPRHGFGGHIMLLELLGLWAVIGFLAFLTGVGD